MNTLFTKKMRVAILVFFISISSIHAQSTPHDSIGGIVELKEIIQVAPLNKFNALEQASPLSTIDQVLDENTKVNMIKRGAYAWEPNIDGFSSERLSVSIDGMQIWGACTDKMDPITSYIETFNLGNVELENGSTGGHGNGFGGMNLQVSQTTFAPEGLSGNLSGGYETNNQQKIGSLGLKWTQEKYYANSNFTYRSAENYYNGQNKEVLFSGFNKMNFNLNSGYRLNPNQAFHTSFIFDRATDVGYPALTMDVSLAQAYIGSVSFMQKKLGEHLRNWETKIYANSIQHKMDDTTRPNVPIHMDMPGWSSTMGVYSQLKLHYKRHSLHLRAEGFQNTSKAEMTMYPNNPKERIMFMYTWPNVQTSVGNIYAKDQWGIGKSRIAWSAKLTPHFSKIKDSFGKRSLNIFYPKFSGSKYRFLKDFKLSYLYKGGLLQPYITIGYTERAPSVSEAYGFYLFNSFDNYDYIGNPDLPNEKALHAMFKSKLQLSDFSLKFEANHYYIKDYIIGKPNRSLSAMTIGSTGVKVYENLQHVQLSNFYLNAKYAISHQWSVKGHLSFHRGKDNHGENLPLISPIQYGAQLNYSQESWGGSIHFHGNGTQKNYNPSYGEDSTQAFSLIDVALSKQWKKLQVNASITNILNKNYSTYTDWNNIPRMGRNITLNINYKF